MHRSALSAKSAAQMSTSVYTNTTSETDAQVANEDLTEKVIIGEKGEHKRLREEIVNDRFVESLAAWPSSIHLCRKLERWKSSRVGRFDKVDSCQNQKP